MYSSAENSRGCRSWFKADNTRGDEGLNGAGRKLRGNVEWEAEENPRAKGGKSNREALRDEMGENSYYSSKEKSLSSFAWISHTF